MVRFIVSERIVRVCEGVLDVAEGKLKSEIEALVERGFVEEPGKTEKYVEFELVKQLSDLCKKNSTSKIGLPMYLHEILEGSEIYEEPYVPPPPNPENQKRLNEIRDMLKEQEYQEMVKNVNVEALSAKSRIGGGGSDLKEMNKHMAIGVSLITTMCACFAFGYWGSYYSLETMAGRVIVGLICSIMGVAADLYFHLTRDLAEEPLHSHNERRPKGSLAVSKHLEDKKND
eukprot:Nk52_evm60s215 gene=Nk52_evmTU60s215